VNRTDESKRIIGFYGGTFNPIHFGHLNLAIELMEKEKLDEVWFCPARTNPIRLDESLISPEHRLKMVELAISDVPHFRVLDAECNRPGPSYTVETLRALKAVNRCQFRLLLGSDALGTFFRWREPETIIRLAPPLVGQRSRRGTLEGIQGGSEVVNALQSGCVTTSLMEISSTMVRARLRQQLYCGHLVPAKVLDYISENHLY
jgi:nicotinate-nucleotide adenylyltransferase